MNAKKRRDLDAFCSVTALHALIPWQRHAVLGQACDVVQSLLSVAPSFLCANVSKKEFEAGLELLTVTRKETEAEFDINDMRCLSKNEWSSSFRTYFHPSYKLVAIDLCRATLAAFYLKRIDASGFLLQAWALLPEEGETGSLTRARPSKAMLLPALKQLKSSGRNWLK